MKTRLLDILSNALWLAVVFTIFAGLMAGVLILDGSIFEIIPAFEKTCQTHKETRP